MNVATETTFYNTIQCALFYRYKNGTTYEKLEEKCSISTRRLRSWCLNWLAHHSGEHPLEHTHMIISVKTRGRPNALKPEEENLLVEAIQYFVFNKTPLTKQGLMDLVQHFVRSLPVERQSEIRFKDERPSIQWINSFIRRYNLKYLPVRMMENQRVETVTAENVAKYIALVKTAMVKYHIHEARFVFNADELGASLGRMLGRSLRRGVGTSGSILIQRAVRVRGSSDRVTIMPVISADGGAYKPIVVFWRKQAHYRFIDGRIQTLHSFLPPCYLLQREIPGVDSAVFHEWAGEFLKETEHLRQGNQQLLLVLDGYSCHLEFRTLNMFKTNGIVVIALPAHTSHVLQPLDVSVFSSFKCHLQREVHRISRYKSVLDAFDVAKCLTKAMSESITPRNIRSGFARTGLWVYSANGPSTAPLHSILDVQDDENSSGLHLEELVTEFCTIGRSLIEPKRVTRSGTVRVDTSQGLHLTAETVLAALRRRGNGGRQSENAAELRHLTELAPRRETLFQHLRANRQIRRERRRRVAAERAALRIVGAQHGNCSQREGSA